MLVDELFLLDGDYISHVYADFELAQITKLFVLLAPVDRVKEHARLTDLELAQNFAMLRTVININGSLDLISAHKEGELA